MKILIHSHTVFSSDGELTPEQLASNAKKREFDAVFVSDHFEDLDRERFQQLVEQCASINECLMIPGYEKSWDGFHIMALGLNEWVDEDDPKVWAEKVRDKGALVVLAHPSKYNFSIPDDLLNICGFVEIWNSKCVHEGIAGPDPRAVRILGKNRLPLCGQDIHAIKHFSNVGLVLTQDSGKSDDIINAIKSSNYKMTNGFLTYSVNLSLFAYAFLFVFHFIRRYLIKIALCFRKKFCSR